MRDEETSREKDSPVSISIFIFNFLNIFEGKSTIKGHYHRNSCHAIKKGTDLKANSKEENQSSIRISGSLRSWR